jgi:hypothetical protein
MTTAAITSAIMADKGFPIGEGALSEAVTDMVLTVLRRLCKRETVAKSGTSRNVLRAERCRERLFVSPRDGPLAGLGRVRNNFRCCEAACGGVPRAAISLLVLFRGIFAF